MSTDVVVVTVPDEVTVLDPETGTIEVISGTIDTGASVVTEGVQGPVGPIGPQGIQGIQGVVGPQGPIGGEYPFNQTTASAVWTVIHNLGYRPGGVRVLDSAGNPVEGFVQDIDANSLTITFSAALAGVAYLS